MNTKIAENIDMAALAEFCDRWHISEMVLFEFSRCAARQKIGRNFYRVELMRIIKRPGPRELVSLSAC